LLGTIANYLGHIPPNSLLGNDVGDIKNHDGWRRSLFLWTMLPKDEKVSKNLSEARTLPKPQIFESATVLGNFFTMQNIRRNIFVFLKPTPPNSPFTGAKLFQKWEFFSDRLECGEVHYWDLRPDGRTGYLLFP